MELNSRYLCTLHSDLVSWHSANATFPPYTLRGRNWLELTIPVFNVLALSHNRTPVSGAGGGSVGGVSVVLIVAAPLPLQGLVELLETRHCKNYPFKA